jgi:polysaccharide deacetylase family protein (PEP-CTERM system associated)
MLNALSVDVEEYFHASEIQESGIRRELVSFSSRVEMQTRQVLEILYKYRTEATFFVVGLVAERYPGLVREIVRAGHEIGCHSYAHKLIYNLTPAEFATDTQRAIRVIEEACGVRPRIYRAPSYSITARSAWALEILAECGFTHDSSIYPISHDRYGIPGFKRNAHFLPTSSGEIYEIPIATIQYPNGKVAPVGGGGYLRMLPYRYTAAGIRRINAKESKPACIYFHPWELDSGQPRVARGVLSRIRTYTGIGGMSAKIERLLKDFRFAGLMRVHAVDVIATRRQQLAPECLLQASGS